MFKAPVARNPTEDEDFSASDFSESEAVEFNSKASNQEQFDEANHPAKIAEKENRAVFWSRVTVIFVLLCAAGGAAGLTFAFTSHAEQKEFTGDFKSFAGEIDTVANKNAVNIIHACHQFAVSLTSYALATNNSFPMVTVPDFERKMEALKAITRTSTVSYLPVVRNSQDRAMFQNYSVVNGLQSLEESQSVAGIPVNTSGVTPFLFQIELDEQGGFDLKPTRDTAPWIPLYQVSPPAQTAGFINWDIGVYPWNQRDLHFMDETKAPVLTEIFDLNMFVSEDQRTNDPTSVYNEPILTNFTEEAKVGAILQTILPWNFYFENLLPEGTETIFAVVSNDCNQTFTYAIQGPTPVFLGEGELYEREYESMKQTVLIEAFQAREGLDLCSYYIHVYPSKKLEKSYKTSIPLLSTGGVLLIFAFTSLVFVLYDFLVQKRQDKVMDSATKSDAIVSSLFPSEFRNRLFEDPEEQKNKAHDSWKANKKTVSFQVPDHEQAPIHDFPELATGKPVADLFPNTTIMMGDLKGFTAWCSVREPTQVFTLLETIYGAFDEIARKRRVFKVETVGDCYVAVSGLPTPRSDHALVMARFANDCQTKMNQLVHKLELVLGPGTANLGIRIGLHSGPTIAGVLRGEKARFQLFGDTINTAARIETTGSVNRIHISQATAEELDRAGKAHWVVPREDIVYAKGKGELNTYWLQPARSGSTFGPAEAFQRNLCSDVDFDNIIEKKNTSVDSGLDALKDDEELREVMQAMSESKQTSRKIGRLIQWNYAIMLPLLERIADHRRCKGFKEEDLSNLEKQVGKDGTVIEEFKSIISLPQFKADNTESPQASIEVSSSAKDQLKEFITSIAACYHKNAFHNFEHASHVVMSVNKLLSRIVAPNPVDWVGDGTNQRNASELHDHTYGITSDPMTQFAIVFSALIHDVDHRGIPNGLLIKEDLALASVYNNKSVAEQNSVDIAWAMLMGDRFKDLRSCIYSNETDLNRFRQIIVNSVLATDIFDKELGRLRKERWITAFSTRTKSGDKDDDINRKATIVIEHIIQASDVSHTMQHWHVYQQWNERLFKEMYQAFHEGRSDTNPADGWYDGEIWFFDNYVIPLAMKLESCGVFGVSSDECLNYAKANRNEWEKKGEALVAEMILKYCK